MQKVVGCLVGMVAMAQNLAVASPRFAVVNGATTQNIKPQNALDVELSKYAKVDLASTVQEALRGAGCKVASQREVGAGTVTADGSVRTPDKADDVFLLCRYKVVVASHDGHEIYKEHFEGDSPDCDPSWVKAEVRRHVERGCRLAVATQPAVPVTSAGRATMLPNADVTAPQSDTRDGTWVAPVSLMTAGLVATIAGAVRWSAVGERTGQCSVTGDCTGERGGEGTGMALTVIGGTAFAIGGLWLLFAPAPTRVGEVSVGPGAIRFAGRF